MDKKLIDMSKEELIREIEIWNEVYNDFESQVNTRSLDCISCQKDQYETGWTANCESCLRYHVKRLDYQLNKISVEYFHLSVLISDLTSKFDLLNQDLSDHQKEMIQKILDEL